jgi:hypothetical protein
VRARRDSNPSLLIRTGGPQSVCAAWSLKCGDVSAGVPLRVPKSGCIAVNCCYQSRPGSVPFSQLGRRCRRPFGYLQNATVGRSLTGSGGCDVG